MNADERKSGTTKRNSDPRYASPHVAKKSLGQNFLIDDNISRKIVSAVSVSRKDHVIEIGPGKGALTRLLSESHARITAVEKDRHLAEDLRRRFEGSRNIVIVTGDFLDYDLPAGNEPLKIVGNIPYNLTSRIVSRLVDQRKRIENAVLMVQDEVACRLSGSAGTKEYGAISVRLQLVSRVEKLFVVTPGCFRPRPRVDSRVVRITFTDTDALADEEGFVHFVKKAFGMRRKMFRHFVAEYYGKQAVDSLQERYQTGRIETFAPHEIYAIFITLEKNARHQ